ncbi:hypothetical protein SMICM17S_03941 [Streptomyces microflavus]
MISKLKVYAGDQHPHAAQQPVPFEITQDAQQFRPPPASIQKDLRSIVAETTVETTTDDTVGTEGEETFAEVTTFESEVPVEGEYTSESLAGRGSGDPQPAAGLGRRKDAIARVRIIPGTCKRTQVAHP